MSAIAGIIDFDGGPVAQSDLARMSRALEPFGRDTLNTVTGDGSGLIVRMDILAPEDRLDRQPVRLPRGETLVFAGRLDNRTALGKKLGLDDARIHALADSALLARAWTRWESGCLDELVGHFSFALWDGNARRIILANSAPKSPPVYYHRQGRRFYFASAPQGLFALPGVPREIDESILADILFRIQGCYDKPLFKRIEKIENGRVLVATAGNQQRTCYWRPDGARSRHFKREEDVWSEFQDLFETVVRSQLRAITPPAVMMSGGLDSTAVCGQAARILARRGETLRGYTRVPIAGIALPPDGMVYNDERRRVNFMAGKHANLSPQFIDPAGEPVLAGLGGYFAAACHVSAVGPAFITGNQVLFRRAADDGVRVMLTGNSGNNTFSYAGLTRLNELFRQGRWCSLIRELRKMRRYQGLSRGQIKQHLLSPLIPGRLVRRRRNKNGFRDLPFFNQLPINREFAEQSGVWERILAAQSRHQGNDILASKNRRIATLLRTNHTSAEALQAQFGMEFRDPCGDRRLAEFCLALPLKYYFADGISRRLARFGLPHLVPEAICRDPARGRLDVDAIHRIRGDADAVEAAILELEADSRLALYFDFDMMRALWRQFRRNDRPRMSLNEEMLCKKILMGTVSIARFIRWFESAFTESTPGKRGQATGN